MSLPPPPGVNVSGKNGKTITGPCKGSNHPATSFSLKLVVGSSPKDGQVEGFFLVCVAVCWWGLGVTGVNLSGLIKPDNTEVLSLQ